jgi:uncharacterized alkaline shock family protein YloU
MAIDPGGDLRAAEPLPCGRDPDTVYDHLRGDRLDEHEQTCPHCQAAARDLAPAITAAQTLASLQPRPPAGFTESVMARVRAETRRGRHFPLPAEPPATLTIAERVVATILSTAAETVPGVICRGCRFPDPGNPAHVAITIVVRFPVPLPAVASQVRRATSTTARQQLGLELRTIDISIQDILTQ